MYASTQKSIIRSIGQPEGDNRNVLFLTESTGSFQPIQRLRAMGWHVIACAPGQDAGDDVKYCQVGVVHFQKYDPDYVAYLQSMFSRHPNIRWVALIEKADLEDERLRSLISEGFHDFHTLPADFRRLNVTLGHANGLGHLLQMPTPGILPEGIDEYGMVGISPPIVQLRRMIRKAATSDSPVLIIGESGTGKELIASSIHLQSGMRNGPFVAVNCASLPATLIQAELFGHERGAFTGAHARKIGLVESAADGSLFLDEIGDLSTTLQVNLLRFLQEKRITRIGGHEELPVNARVIAATNMDLEKAIEAGIFRRDLYYRLNVIQIRTVPLRERRMDIEYLARYFLEKFRAEGRRTRIGFTSEALTAMRQYDWPGNVRELSNKVLRALVVAEGKAITSADLDLSPAHVGRPVASLDDARSEAEAKAILGMMVYTKSNMSETARLLGITRATLYRLLAKHNILPSRQREEVDAA